MDFEGELDLALPPDLPNRDRVVVSCARHLALIAAANEYMNLTRITSEREAAVKHVLDSIVPWRLFAGADTVMDAGTGAGLPGIPLAIVLPETQFVLVDSTQKKARFVESVAADLQLPNVEVAGERAEDLLRQHRFHIVTARAIAPVERALVYFAAGLKGGASILLYKGPCVEAELREAEGEARSLRARMEVVMRYSLPDALGARTIVRISPQ